ncbi:hypothetical protein, partial [Bradyrhizobium sp. 23AC]
RDVLAAPVAMVHEAAAMDRASIMQGLHGAEFVVSDNDRGLKRPTCSNVSTRRSGGAGATRLVESFLGLRVVGYGGQPGVFND